MPGVDRTSVVERLELGSARRSHPHEAVRAAFLRSLTRRGLRGVKLVISDAHEGLKAATAKVLKATWQRCRVHFMRSALAHAPKEQRQTVAALIRTAFVQESEADALAFMTLPKAHRLQIHSTNPLERLNGEIKRRPDVVGIFANEAAIARLIGAQLLEQNDEWQLQRRYMQLEGLQSLTDNPPARLSAVIS
jgi:putative transposase